VTVARITPRALSDLDSIADYSMQTWGAKQTEKYLKELDARFKWLAAHPNAGKSRDEIAEGYRSYRQGSHQIFYVLVGGDIAVIGIPHGSMDIDAYFQDPG
jgi:toxin ParE1/3/4